jgi:hypothetical protein
MKKPTVVIAGIEREMTSEEFTQYQADQAEAAQKAEARLAKETARQAVLDKLGLTAEEVAALLA